MTSLRPLIAILRGVAPSEAAEVGHLLAEEGFSRIEVPMNSPKPLLSIRQIADLLGNRIIVGAGTVATVDEVKAVKDAGGRIIVSPNTDPEVIAATRNADMESLPGALTATECLSALAAGADRLKLFPASVLGISGVSALRTVLPRHVPLYAVGGVGPDNFGIWAAAGINGFGVGTALYQPGMSLGEIRKNAIELIKACERVFPNHA